MATGPITFQAKDRVLRIYEQMPDPKFVIAIGECACSSGVFKNCYGIKGGIDTLIPVDVYIPGCPPRPEAILDGVVKLTEKLKDS
jgi:Ni,Fe-hydrogenase III small subunit